MSQRLRHVEEKSRAFVVQADCSVTGERQPPQWQTADPYQDKASGT